MKIDFWKYLPDSISMRMSIHKLRELERKLLNERYFFLIPSIFEGKGKFNTIRCKQDLWEVEKLFQLVMQQKPECVCEIGVYRGGTFYLWCKAAKPDASIIGIDLPGGLDNYFSSERMEFYKSFGKEKQNVQLLAMDSHNKQTVECISSLIGAKQIDFLFIDGDHSYEGVKADFEMYRPLVRKKGIIAFHDIIPRLSNPEIEVYRFWNEIKSEYESQEFISKEGSFAEMVGVGVIWIS